MIYLYFVFCLYVTCPILCLWPWSPPMLCLLLCGFTLCIIWHPPLHVCFDLHSVHFIYIHFYHTYYPRVSLSIHTRWYGSICHWCDFSMLLIHISSLCFHILFNAPTWCWYSSTHFLFIYAYCPRSCPFLDRHIGVHIIPYMPTIHSWFPLDMHIAVHICLH